MKQSNQAKKIISESPRIILIYGEEEFLVENLLNELVSHYCPDEQSKYNYDVFDGDTINLIDLIDVCSQFPMMSDRRVVVVKKFEKLFPAKADKNYEKNPFFRYLNKPSDDTLLILVGAPDKLKGAGTKKPAADKIVNSNYFPYNLLLKNYSSVEFPKVYDNKIPDWIKSGFQESGYTITNEAIQILSMMVNPSLREIKNEIEKIIIAYPEKNQIDKNDILKLVGDTRGYSVFELQKQVSNRNLSQAMKITSELIRVSRQEVLILKILTNHIISLIKAKSLIARNSSKQELASTLGKPIFFIDEFVSGANKYSMAELIKSIEILYKTDKTLKTSSIDTQILFQKLLYSIMHKEA